MISARTSRGTRIGQLWRWPALAIVSAIVLPGLVAFPAHAASQTGARAALTFPDGTLLRDQSTSAVYLSFAGVRHWITNGTTLDALGYGATPATQLTHALIVTVPNGSTLSARPVPGIGRLYPLSPILSSQVSLMLGQASAVPGQSFKLYGTGFRPGENVKITAPNFIGYAPANSAGHFSASVQASSSAGYGLHQVFARGNLSGAFGVEVFHVIPAAAVQISAAPSIVHPSTSITVSGSGFLAGEQVQVFLNALTSTQGIAGASGAFGPLPVLVPAVTRNGTYTVTAYGASSARAANTRIVVTTAPVPTPIKPHITLAHGTVHRGDRVSISGRGFAGNETVLVRFNNGLMQAATVDRFGVLSHVSFRVPEGSRYGANMVTVTGSSSGRVASATLIVVAKQSLGIAVNPTTVRPGQYVAVSGHGFKPHELVLLYVRDKLTQAPAADRNGNFGLTLKIDVHAKRGSAFVVAIGSQSHRRVQRAIYIR